MFCLRRALRPLPAYSVVVAAAVAADSVIDTGGTAKDAVVSFSYVANWAVDLLGLSAGSLLHAWSLPVEEQFYLLRPVFLVLRVRRCRGCPARVGTVTGPLVLISYVLAACLALGGVSLLTVHHATPARAVQLLLAVLPFTHDRGDLGSRRSLRHGPLTGPPRRGAVPVERVNAPVGEVRIVRPAGVIRASNRVIEVVGEVTPC